MWCEILRARRCAAAVLAAIAVTASPASAGPMPTVTVDEISLTASPADSAVEADEAPVVVPLPPALGPGLMGLAGLVVSRQFRRRRTAR